MKKKDFWILIIALFLIAIAIGYHEYQGIKEDAMVRQAEINALKNPMSIDTATFPSNKCPSTDPNCKG